MNSHIYDQSIELLHQVTDAARAANVLLELAEKGRPAFRGVVAALEVHPHPQVIDELRSRAGGVGEGDLSRLLRRARGREEAARRRHNPLPRNEGFRCEHCRTDVRPADGGVQRNHCPVCLHSLHVDRIPGDRDEACRGLMVPVAVETLGADRTVLRHRCARCGAERRIRAALGIRVQPDPLEAIARLARAVEEP